MRIIDRYLIKNFASPFFYCAALFSILFVIIDGFNNLDDYIRHSISIKIIFSYYLFLMPSIFVQIIPVGALVAILYALGNLNRHNEIIALKASGLSALQILFPFLFAGMVLSFMVMFLGERIVPGSMITSTAIKDGLILKGKNNFGDRAIKNVTLYSSKNRMIYAKEYEVANQTLNDLVLEERLQKRTKLKYIAKKAIYTEEGWVLYDVIKQRINQRGDIVGKPSYLPKLSIKMPERPNDFVMESSQIEFMSAKQLGEYILHLKDSSHRLAEKLQVDFHQKIAFPFVSLIVMLIGAPLALRTRRGSAMVGIGTSVVIVLLYYALNSICLALGKGSALPPLAASWASNVIFALIGIYFIKKIS